MGKSPTLRQRENTRQSLEILNSFRHKIDQQLDSTGASEGIRVSRDAQLHPWATTLATDRSLVFVHPAFEQEPQQSHFGLISRAEFIQLEALMWNIARSLMFDLPSRIYSKLWLKTVRINTAKMALRISEDWDSRLKSSSAHTSSLQLQSHFRKQVHLLLKQLLAYSSSSGCPVLERHTV